MVNSAWLIPFFPLVGFIINGIFYKNIPKKIVSIVGCGSVLASFIIACGIFFSNTEVSTTLTLFDLLNVGDFSIPVSILIDPISLLMTLVITGVGFLIHLYSVGYMSHDKGFARYFSYLNLFVFSMLVLVLSANYVLMFVGWEGVGFCSYLLIGFWYKVDANNTAAKKAFVMNRIGDLGFLAGLFLMYVTFGSISFADVFERAASFQSGDIVLVTITLLLFFGATGKSAQIPLYTWLPDAMAGPTPVSALIHAATMVTAGVYMIVRSNVLYTLAPVTLAIVAAVGIATALFAATIALSQNDIKKVLAYSTVSQLGYMFFALGLGAYSTGIFHLMTHAFFKALLFLGAGSVIHAMSGEQDIRRMGGLKKYLPVTYITFLIATLAISGIPPFAGFFSKDEILTHAYEHNFLLWLIALLGALLTAFYMFRLFYLTFYGTFRGTDEQKHHLHESPKVMTIPLVILAVLSAIGGFLGLPEIFGTNAVKNFLAPVTSFVANTTPLPGGGLSHSTEIILMLVSVVAVLLAILAARNQYLTKSVLPPAETEKLSAIHQVLYKKYFIDELYEKIITKPLDALSARLNNIFETIIIDGLVNLTGGAVMISGTVIRFVQNGKIGFYLFCMVIGIILIFFMNFIK